MAIDDSVAETAATTTDVDVELEDFDAEVYYPYAPPQQWVVLHDEVDADALGVYTFVMAHLNPHDGKFDAHFGRQRIGERFGRSLDWVDKRLKVLVTAGAMTKVPTYWVDTHDHAKGRTTKAAADDGTKRAQAPNRYRVRIAPPGGVAYAGPIKIAEFYRPQLIAKRTKTAGDGGAAGERPPRDQAKQGDTADDQREPAKPQVKGGPPHSGRGGRHTAAGGGRHTAAQKNTGTGKTTGGKTTGTTDHADSVGEPADLRPAGSEPSTAASVDGSSELELSSNHQYARELDDTAPVTSDNPHRFDGVGSLQFAKTADAERERERITTGARARSWTKRTRTALGTTDPARRAAALAELEAKRAAGDADTGRTSTG